MSIFNISKLLIILFLVMGVALSGCFVAENPYTAVAPGMWRATLTLDPVAASVRGESAAAGGFGKLEEIVRGELPFNFEVKYEGANRFYIEIHNGEERIRVDSISFGRDRKTAKDTILIHFPVFDSYIRAIYQEKVMQGEWVVNYRENYTIPFVAKQGEAHRFTTLRKPPAANVSGRWEVRFDSEGEQPYLAVGEFQQQDNYLTGTFLTETGDYRFLEGTVQDDKVYLSCFDGSHAFLFEAKMQPNGTLSGSFLSGTHYRATWEARRNSEFQLNDPHSLTFLKPGYDRVEFAFENPDGKIISLNEPPYQGKVTIIQLMGTWCPNCRDETEFLLQYRKKNPQLDIAIIGLAFERYRDRDRSMQAIRQYRDYFQLDYEILLAGTSSDKAEAARALPMLNQVLSYPTMIIVDKRGRVRQIHTGFSGPATSAYAAFQREFDDLIKQLLAESS